MTTRRSRCAAVLAAVTMIMGSVAMASAEEAVLEPATETLYISAGCPAATPAGTCTSTRWLGTSKGDAKSNFTTSITPVDEVYYQLDGSLNWRDYTSDESLRPEGYPLRTDQPLSQTIVLGARGPGIATTVHGRIDAVTTTGEDVSFGPLEETVNILPEDTATVTFDFEIPAELEGVALEYMTAYVAVHGVNAYAGTIDQAGGSTVTIPYWVPAEAVVSEEPGL